MNVASLDLCKRLYEQSGWRNTDQHHQKTHKGDWAVRLDPEWGETVLASFDNGKASAFKPGYVFPAYDLGYLLRKLPVSSYIATRKDGRATASTGNYKTGQSPYPITEHGDTPEDAACKLAIELFKRGLI